VNKPLSAPDNTENEEVNFSKIRRKKGRYNWQLALEPLNVQLGQSKVIEIIQKRTWLSSK
jgi:hypothetical protein